MSQYMQKTTTTYISTYQHNGTHTIFMNILSSSTTKILSL